MKRFPPHKPRNAGGWPDRDRAQQAKFRRQALALSDERCAHVDPYGTRCEVTGAAALIAHHRDRGN